MADNRSPEQKASDEAVLEAIQNRMRLQSRTPGHPDDWEISEAAGEIVTEYVVVACVNSMDLAERNSARYAFITIESGEGPASVPVHNVRGLLHQGLAWLDQPDPE